MNSQIAAIREALKSNTVFIILACFISASLFLDAGFVSVGVIWFFALGLYNGLYSTRPWIAFSLRTHFVLLLPVLLFFLFAIGLFSSANPGVGVDVTVRKIHMVLLPIAFILANRKVTSKNLHVILSVFAVGCLLTSLFCLVTAMINALEVNQLGYWQGRVRYHYLYSYLLTEPLGITPVYLSMFCNLGLLAMLYSPFVTNRRLKVLIVLYLILFIILCGSGAGVVSMCLVIMLWLKGKVSKRAFRAVLLGLFIVFSLLAVFKPQILKDRIREAFKFTYPNDNGNLSNYAADKLQIWESALTAILDQPITGYGTGDGQRAFETAMAAHDLTMERVDSLNPHNEFLSTMLDIGMPGLLTCVAMLVIPFGLAVKKRNPLAISFMVMVVMFFFVESILLRQKGIVFFAFFYSLIVYWLQGLKEKSL